MNFGNLKTFLLALPQQLGQHSGVKITDQITAIIEHFNISESIGYFMTDNATNNDKLRTILRSILRHLLSLIHKISMKQYQHLLVLHEEGRNSLEANLNQCLLPLLLLAKL